MSLDIVIPVFNQPELLGRCVKSLEQSQLPQRTTLWLIDDASQPDLIKDSLESIRRSSPIRTFIRRNTKPKGFGESVNICASAGSNDLVLILNSDVFLDPEAISAMIQAASQETVGVVGPLLTFDPESMRPNYPAGKVQHAGIAFDVNQRPIHVFSGWSTENPRVAIRRQMQALTGACMMIRRKVWTALGGFDKIYGLGTYEDLDLCFRARMNQLAVLFIPEARGIHTTNASITGSDRQFPLQQNALLFQARFSQQIFWDEWIY